MRILFVLEHFHPYTGGAEELFRSLTTSLVRNGFHVDVVTTRYDSKLPVRENYMGVNIHRVRSGNRYFFTLMSLPAILKLARKADIIHTTSYNSALPAFAAAWLLRKKIFITFHEVWHKLWFQLPFTSRFLKWAYFHYERFILHLNYHTYIAVSRFTENRLKRAGIRAEKIVQIYNGLDYERFDGYVHRPPEHFTYCFFGRLGISKGIDILLDATKRFTEIHPEARLKFIIPTYPKPVYRQVMKLVKDHGIEDRIVMLHDLPKDVLLNEICQSSCVIIPSHSEGFCFAAAESVAMGVPIVSSDRGALKETVTGKAVRIHHLISDDLVGALERAYNNDWDDIPVRHFTLEDSVEKYLELYREI